MPDYRFSSAILVLVLMLPTVGLTQSSDLERVLRGAIGVMEGIQGQQQQQGREAQRRQQELLGEQQRRQQELYREQQQREQALQREQQQAEQEAQRRQQELWQEQRRREQQQAEQELQGQQQQQPWQEQYLPQQPPQQQYSQPQDAEAEAEARRQAQLEREALVRRVQQRLTDLGYAPGPVDGVMGARTRSSIREFQRDMGLRADGEADTVLLGVLEDVRESPRTTTPPAPVVDEQPRVAEPATPTPAPPRAMVREIQRGLDALGYQPGPADGVMGSRTRSSIRVFQRDHGLSVDGEPDLMLLAQLRNLQPPSAAGTAAVEETITEDTEQAADTGFDILGIQPGMAMAEAEALVREHLGENLAVFTTPELDREASSEELAAGLSSGKLFLDMDTDELIGIYDYPEGASDEVVAVFREVHFPRSGAPTREAVVQALLDKYGEQQRVENPLLAQRDTLAWHTASETNRRCGGNAVVKGRASWLADSGERVDSWKSEFGGGYRQWRLPSLGPVTRDCGTSVIARLNVRPAAGDTDEQQVEKLSLRLFDSAWLLELAREAREQAAQLAEQAGPELKL